MCVCVRVVGKRTRPQHTELSLQWRQLPRRSHPRGRRWRTHHPEEVLPDLGPPFLWQPGWRARRGDADIGWPLLQKLQDRAARGRSAGTIRSGSTPWQVRLRPACGNAADLPFPGCDARSSMGTEREREACLGRCGLVGALRGRDPRPAAGPLQEIQARSPAASSFQCLA